MIDEHIGFLKAAGVREAIGRGVKAVGRALGSPNLERRGMSMQYGRSKFVSGNVPKMKVHGPPVKPKAPPASPPKVQLVIPHGTAKAEARVMKGIDKTKPQYLRGGGA